MGVLLPGGAGFIGSHLADHLLVRGHEVAIVDDLSSGKKENVPEGAIFYERDIRCGCDDLFEEFEPDAHAGVTVLGTRRLLESCVRHGVGKVVLASTGGAIYGEQSVFPAPEDH